MIPPTPSSLCRDVLAALLSMTWADDALAQFRPAAAPIVAAHDARVGAPSRSLLKARLGQTFAVGDLNRDGLQDVAVTDFVADTLTVLLGEAGGGFSTATTIATGRGPRAVVAADFDNDGTLDLCVGEFLSGAVRLFAGHGDGQFHVRQTLPLVPGVSSVAARDVNGDGLVDLAVAGALSGTIGVTAEPGRDVV